MMKLKDLLKKDWKEQQAEYLRRLSEKDEEIEVLRDKLATSIVVTFKLSSRLAVLEQEKRRFGLIEK